MKKRNLWRNFSTASVIAAAVATTFIPADAQAETPDRLSDLQKYFTEITLETNDGTAVTVTYDAEAKKFIGHVAPGTTAVHFKLAVGDEYKSNTAYNYRAGLATTPTTLYAPRSVNRNVIVRDADNNIVDEFAFEIIRAPYPQTAENSSDLVALSARIINGANGNIASKFHVEQDGVLTEVAMNAQTLETYNEFVLQPTDPANIQFINAFTLTPTVKYGAQDTEENSATYTYKVNGQIVDSLANVPHTAYEYAPGKIGSKIEITVTPAHTAPEGSKPKTYTFIIPKEIGSTSAITNVTIASPNNHQFLAALGEGKLTQQSESAQQRFNKDVLAYDTIVNYNIDQLLMKPTANGANSTFVYTVNGDEIRTTDTSSILPLTVGDNKITLQVIPENGDASTSPVYTFNVERKANYNIASITSDEIRISGKLRPTLTTLAGIIEGGIDKYAIALTAEDATKNIVIKQNDNVIVEGKGTVNATLDASKIVIDGRKNISQNPVTVTIGDDKDSITYTLDTWVRNPDAPNRTYAVLPAPGQFVNEHAQTVTGSLGSFGWGDGWDTALYSTSANLSAEASGTPGLSLGGFGGFVTYQFDEAVRNDPAHPYGADFIINGNGFTGNEEPGGIMVAQDKDKDGKPDKDANGEELWYEIAGSEHYEDTTLWDYSITYTNTVENFTPNLGKNVPWTDSLGRTGEIIANGYHSQIYFPMPDNYAFEGNAANNLMSDKEITYTGTNIQTLKTLFGYGDVSPNNLGVTVAQNPYTHKHGGGGFIDLDWAVDGDGKPVNLDEVSFIKVYTNQQTDGGAVGEKSPEILGVLRVNDPTKADGKTATPTIEVNGTKVALQTEDDFTPVVVESLENIAIAVDSSAANIYINNEKTATRTYETVPEKGIVRVIVQTGNLQPSIYTLKITEQAVQTVIDAIAALPETITLADADAINMAKSALDTLTAEQLALVSNTDVLTKALETLATLQQTLADNEAAAKAVSDAIAALPETITLTDADAINTAKSALDALTAEQLTLVLNADVLTKALETLEKLQLPSTPVMPSQPTTPQQPDAGDDKEQDKEDETPTEPEQPNPSEDIWKVDGNEHTFANQARVTLPTNATADEVAVTIANDTVTIAFTTQQTAVSLDDYATITLPSDVFSPTDGTLVQRLADGSVIAVPHVVIDGQFVLKTRSSGEFALYTTTKQFTDIQQDGHQQYIEALTARAIVNGTTASTYTPKASMTRGQFSAMLQRALGLPKTAAPTFSDIQGHQFANEMQSLVALGVLNGDGDRLRPNDSVTRKHAALMIARLFEQLNIEVPHVSVEDMNFTDKAAISDDALYAVALVQKLQIFTGKEDGRFDPNAPLTRSQMAKVLYQTLTYAKMM